MRVCAEPLYTAAIKIDKQQLMKTMISLNEVYDDHQKIGKHLPSEPEFRSYTILLKVPHQ